MVTLAGHGARRARSARRPARRAAAVLLVATGAHAAALRAVLASLPESTDLTVILRTATASRQDMALGAELGELILRRGGRLVELVGARSAVALDAARLQAMVGDVAARDLYVCGPAWFADTVVRAARGAGVPESRIHLTAGTI
ncbi:MAG: ferric reductase [Solirubrobacterales bacterium]|nr:ferric reductase [Solirubrobacterales bacterium]